MRRVRGGSRWADLGGRTRAQAGGAGLAGASGRPRLSAHERAGGCGRVGARGRARAVSGRERSGVARDGRAR